MGHDDDSGKQWDKKAEAVAGAVKKFIRKTASLISPNWNTAADAKREPVRQVYPVSVEATPEPPAPAKSEEELLEEELSVRDHIFSALLSVSAEALAQSDRETTPLSAGNLLRKWRYSLTVGECPVMLARLDELISRKEATDPRQALADWMAFLEEAGIRQLDSDIDRLTVTQDNRANYSNGLAFRDGALCVIEERPWLYRDRLIRPGHLTAETTEPVQLDENAEELKEETKPDDGNAGEMP